MKQECVLTIEPDEKRQELFVHGDELGLRNLANLISRLADSAAKGQSDHDHLATPEWAGFELTSTKRDPNSTLINQVTIGT